MDISGTYTLNAPREQVWDALFDPEILKRAVPSCESIERTGADEYAMRLHVDVAGTRGSYDGSLRVLEAQKPESYRLVVDGTGARGILHGDGRLRLETNDAGATVVTYSGQAQLGGAIASIGVGVARTAAQHLIQDFFGRLQQVLPASVAATVAPAAVSSATSAAPPSDAFSAPVAPANAPVDALLPRTAPIIPPPAPPTPPSPQPAPPAEALATPSASAAPAPAVSTATEVPATATAAATGNGATAMPRATPPPASSATAARRVAITDGSIEDGKRAARTIWVGIIIAIVVVAVVILYIITR